MSLISMHLFIGDACVRVRVRVRVRAARTVITPRYLLRSGLGRARPYRPRVLRSLRPGI